MRADHSGGSLTVLDLYLNFDGIGDFKNVAPFTRKKDMLSR